MRDSFCFRSSSSRKPTTRARSLGFSGFLSQSEAGSPGAVNQHGPRSVRRREFGSSTSTQKRTQNCNARGRQQRQHEIDDVGPSAENAGPTTEAVMRQASAEAPTVRENRAEQVEKTHRAPAAGMQAGGPENQSLDRQENKQSEPKTAPASEGGSENSKRSRYAAV